MITQAQIDLAKTLWEQARTMAAQSHDAWQLVIRSQSVYCDSLRAMGLPVTAVTQQFENLMNLHSTQYKAALEHLDNMADTYQQMLAKYKSGG